MAKVTFEQMLDAGVHFGHLKRKWNANMGPYIFSEKKGIHVIDLNKTLRKAEVAQDAMKQIAKSGKKILFVATKKQAKHIVSELVQDVNMPYVTERWSGGILTNFGTTRKSIRKIGAIDKMGQDGTLKTMSKRERLQVSRSKEKLEKNLGTIADMTRLPAAVFIVDIKKEHIALAEAVKLNIPVFAMVDTNSDPTNVDFIIPSNDDATKSISLIVSLMTEAIKEGLGERKAGKDKAAAKEAPKKDVAAPAAKVKAPAAKEEAPAKEVPAKEEAPTKEAPATEETK